MGARVNLGSTKEALTQITVSVRDRIFVDFYIEKQ